MTKTIIKKIAANIGSGITPLRSNPEFGIATIIFGLKRNNWALLRFMMQMNIYQKLH